VTSLDPAAHRRTLSVLAAIAVAALLGAFLAATRGEPDARGYRDPARADAKTYARAPTHAEIASGRHSTNRARQPDALAKLAPTGVGTPQAVHDEAAWQAAVEKRAARRAYDGAPPVIPHPIDQRGFPNCVTCHEQTFTIRGVPAPKPSHDPRSQCVQCHVVQQAPMPVLPALDAKTMPDNKFAGLESAGKGARAWSGAPPQIPHTTLMRERCASCHGSLSDGLHSSHPLRQSCTQCHALSAALDQRAPLQFTGAVAP
jgi:nitrate reductase (cytochrome), electron transfer subunit